MPFSLERDLQRLVEANLQSIFGFSFVATEFSTGAHHGGRIDTLAVSPEGFPVIIEYKITKDPGVTNQALYYLSWLKDHKGDFESAVTSAGWQGVVDWGHIHVLCIAPGYDKYTLHAVKQSNSSLELWQYRRFENGTFEMEPIFKASLEKSNRKQADNGSPSAVEENVPEYTVETLLAGKSQHAVEIYSELQERISALSDGIQCVPNKHYVAFKYTRNLACLEMTNAKVKMFLPLSWNSQRPAISENCAGIGHRGTGDLQVNVSSMDEVEVAMTLVQEAFLSLGGDL